MPAETLHETHQSKQGAEKQTSGGFVYYDNDRNSNIKSTLKFEHSGLRADKYNTSIGEGQYSWDAPTAKKIEVQADDTESAEQESDRIESRVVEELVKELQAQRQVYEAMRRELDEVKEALKKLSSDKSDGESSAAVNPDDDAQAGEAAAQSADSESDKNEEDESQAESGKDSEDSSAEEDLSKEGPKSDTASSESSESELEGQNAEPPSQAEAEPENESENTFEVKINAELQLALKNAQDAYAEATAKDRSGYAGHLLHSSNKVSKLPLIGKWLQAQAEKSNERHDKKTIGPAREEYKRSVLAIQQEIRDQIRAEMGETQEAIEAIRLNASDLAIQSELDLELKITAKRLEQSGDTNKFLNWWVNQEGLGGKLKKAGVVGGIGITAGMLVGLAGAPVIVGTALGAGAGAGVGAYVTKKRAAAIAKKEDGESIASQQSRADLERKRQYVAAQKEQEDGFANISELVNMTEERTAAETTRNRSRLRSAVAAGALGGSLGAGAGAGIRGAIENGIAQAEAAPQQPEKAATPTVDKPEVPPAPELEGTSFDVEYGNGYTQELVDFANANGHELTGQQSWDLHQDIMERFGPDYIDINGAGNDIYTDGGDVRLAESGSATWNDGVGQFIQEWMQARGLW